MLRGTSASEPEYGEEGDDYEQRVRAWAWAVWNQQAPAKDGFAAAPTFPVRPAFGPGLEQPGPSISELLESH
jgi:hypothetical protein